MTAGNSSATMAFFLAPKISPAAEEALKSSAPLARDPVAVNSPTEKRRAASWAGWVRNVLPSQRPERGGTIRDRGYWESVESVNSRRSRRPRSSTYRTPSQRLKRMGSDQIVRWNTAKELSKRSRPPDDNQHASIPQITHQGIHRRLQITRRRDRDDNYPKATDRGQEDALRSQRLDSVATNVIDRRLLHTQKLVKAKEEAHKQRRSLKESGDYLGVQGFNPETGELDVITPTESDEGNQPTNFTDDSPIINVKGLDIGHRSRLTPDEEPKWMKKMRLAIQQEKLRQFETEKQQLRAMNMPLKWRRKTKQWSSAHEPALSTIAQSQLSTSSSGIN